MKNFLLLLWVLVFPLLADAQQAENISKNQEVRYVRSRLIKVYEKPDIDSSTIGEFKYLDRILIDPEATEQRENGSWVKVVSPLHGYIFQKRLIRKRPVAKSSEKSIRTQAEVESGGQGESGVKRSREPAASSQGKSSLWYGLGISLYTLPEESGYSSSVAESYDLFLDNTDTSSFFSKFRFGINFTKASSDNYETSTNSLYGVYKLQANRMRGAMFEFYALGGIALMMSSISGGTTGSSSGLGFIAGTGSYLNFEILSLPDYIKGGVQYIYFTRQAEFSDVKKYVGSNQVQFFVSTSF